MLKERKEKEIKGKKEDQKLISFLDSVIWVNKEGSWRGQEEMVQYSSKREENVVIDQMDETLFCSRRVWVYVENWLLEKNAFYFTLARVLGVVHSWL